MAAEIKIYPSTQDFVEKGLHGSSKWTLHKVVLRPVGAGNRVGDYDFYRHMPTEIRKEADALATLSKQCPEIYREKEYIRVPFSQPQPDETMVKSALEKEAAVVVKKPLFGSADKKRATYVMEHLEEKLQEAMKKWAQERSAHEEDQDKKAMAFHEEEARRHDESVKANEEFKASQASADRFMYGRQDEIEEDLNGMNPGFPSELTLFYQLDLPKRLVNLHIEVPSTMSFMDRVCSSKETNKLYLKIVSGLSYVLAGQCLNSSVKIDKVFVSSSSSEFNKKTASLEEKTLMSVLFDRETYIWAVSSRAFLPFESLAFFDHALNVDDDNEMLPVDPLSMIPACDRPAGSNIFIDDDPSIKSVDRKDENCRIVTEDAGTAPADITSRSAFLGLPGYRFPSLNLISGDMSIPESLSQSERAELTDRLASCLNSFGLGVSEIICISGPTLTLFKLYVKRGVRFSSVKNIEEDIAMAVRSRNVQVIQYDDFIGIEVVNPRPKILSTKAILNSEELRNSSAALPLAIGSMAGNEVEVIDLKTAPHVLVSGSARQGKTTALNNMIFSLLFTKHPSELKLVIVDPKNLEFKPYASLLRHFLAVSSDSISEQDELNKCIVSDIDNATRVFRGVVGEMKERVSLFASARVNEIVSYNEMYATRSLSPMDGHRFLPYIVIVIDEFNMLLESARSTEDRKRAKQMEQDLIEIAQGGASAGIHMVVSAQRSNADDMNPSFKQNFQKRISFKVGTRFESNSAIGSSGAESLSAPGDCLYDDGDELFRIQSGLMTYSDLHALTGFIGDQRGATECFNTPYYLTDSDVASDAPSYNLDMTNLDENFEMAARQVVILQRGSTSDLQRKLGMGYAKAGRVMDQLEAAGIVGPMTSPGKPREVLVSSLEELERILDAFRRVMK